MAEKCCNPSFLKRRLAVVESMVGKSKHVTSILKKKIKKQLFLKCLGTQVAMKRQLSLA